MKTKTLLFAAVAAAMTLPAAAADKWDMPMAYSASNYHSQIGAEFAAEVTENSGGKLEIVAHPGGSLFGGAEIYPAVRRGLAPIGERLISALSNDEPMFGIDSIPFLATTFDDAWTLYQVSKPALQQKLDDAGLMLLYSVPWPPQSFYSARPVASKADTAGMKFRAYNAITSQIAEELGMIPTTIEAAELQQAFATGVAESMISSGSTGYDRKLWEHVDYYYDVRAWLPRNMVIVNKDAWAQLDADTQSVVRRAAAAAERKGWSEAERLANWYVEQFVANGMNVADASEQLVADFVAAGEVIRADWLARAGAEGQQVLDAFNAAK